MDRRRRMLVLIGVLLAGALVAGGCAADDPPRKPERPTTEFTSAGGVDLTVATPVKGARINSPLEVGGQAPGSWSFEADFPIEVLDADRRTVGEGHATVKGDWMKDSSVDFSGTVVFDPPRTRSGFLVLRKANPSGLPEHDDDVEVPIRFER